MSTAFLLLSTRPEPFPRTSAPHWTRVGKHKLQSKTFASFDLIKEVNIIEKWFAHLNVLLWARNDIFHSPITIVRCKRRYNLGKSSIRFSFCFEFHEVLSLREEKQDSESKKLFFCFSFRNTEKKRKNKNKKLARFNEKNKIELYRLSTTIISRWNLCFNFLDDFGREGNENGKMRVKFSSDRKLMFIEQYFFLIWQKHAQNFHFSCF